MVFWVLPTEHWSLRVWCKVDRFMKYKLKVSEPVKYLFSQPDCFSHYHTFCGFIYVLKSILLFRRDMKKTKTMGLFLTYISLNVASYHEWTERPEYLHARASHHVGHSKLELLRHLNSPFVEHFNGKENIQPNMSVVAIECELAVQPIDVALKVKVQEVLTIELYQGVEITANSRT